MQFRNRKRTSTKPKRKYSTGWLEDRLDVLTSFIVRSRNPRCVLCESVVRLENGHLFTRTWRPTRWDISPDGNCQTLCHDCNMAHESHAQRYIGWYVASFGRDAYEALERRAHASSKFTYTDLETLVSEYEGILKRLRKAA